MTEHIIEQIRGRLFEMQDLQYRDFHKNLIPTIDENTIIGVRTPMLRAYAKELIKAAEHNPDLKSGLHNFITDLPHKYYEENNLHAFLLENLKDFDECVRCVNDFLPFVDNWATCDCMAPGIFKKNAVQLLPYIEKWIADDYAYKVRFGIEMLMKYFLDDLFDVEYLEMAANVRSDEYYVNMMIAWYFATAFAKQYDTSVVYIEEKRLSVWVHNKAIQKAVESCRVTQEHKAYLKTLRIAKNSNNLL